MACSCCTILSQASPNLVPIVYICRSLTNAKIRAAHQEDTGTFVDLRLLDMRSFVWGEAVQLTEANSDRKLGWFWMA